MHPAAYAFIARTLPPDVARVLEIGSYDVNATAQGLYLRQLAPLATWRGIDERAGPGVDVVATAARYRTRDRFDVVISAETLEHTPDPAAVIACAWRHLTPGGLLILTAAAPERAPHGCDGGAVPDGEYYAGIAPDVLRALLADWDAVTIAHDPAIGDVYATAVRAE